VSDSTPIWKKEIRLGRKPKEQRAEKAPASKDVPKSNGAPESNGAPKGDAAPKGQGARRKLPSLPSFSVPKLPSPALPKPSRRSGATERIVGLKIGGSQIAAACIANNGRAKLERIARVPLASGVVSGGELRDTEALADALRSFFEENKLPQSGVRLGVASSRIGVRSIEIPAIDNEEQFLNAVRFRAQEALPIPLDEAVLDYRVLGEREAEGGQRFRRVLLVVAHRELVDRYIEACRLAGVTLAGIDLEAFALLRAIAPPSDRDQSALVAVSIGHDRTTLAVSDGRVCEFSRVLEWGGGELNTELASAFGMTEKEVEPLKRSLSLDGTGDAPEGFTPEQAHAAVDVLKRGVDALVRELVSSLTYYQSQPGSHAIGEIVLTGGGAKLAGLPEELGRQIGVPVRRGNPLGRLEVTEPVDEADVDSLAIAVGLGIED
jgi:type IV pilus assembly protein PilM